MKTFEEKWTAWLDGELRGKELAEFEASLPDRAAAEAEKLEAQKLGSLLKQHLPARAMGNEEFFNHQLRGRIEADATGESTAGERGGRVSPGRSAVSFGRARPRSRCLSSAHFL